MFLVVLLLFAVLYRETALDLVVSDPRLSIIFQLLVAGTVIAILRNQGGINTFGVFGPAIIAFVWIETGAVWGLVIFTYVLAVGLASRNLIVPARLGTPHRVAILLVATGTAMLTLLTLGERLSTVPSLTAAVFFPIVLMTWYADRFAESVAQIGWQAPTKRLLKTVFVITVAYMVVSIQSLMTWVASTPESWVGLVATNVVLGTMVDTRVIERFRFRSVTSAGDSMGDVLTMTERNRDYVDRYNDSGIMSTLDKSSVKRLFHGIEVPTPETYLVVEARSDLEDLTAFVQSSTEFVIKPEGGYGGEGVLVVNGRTEDGAFKTQKGLYDESEVIDHAREIFQGKFAAEYESSGVAIVEALVVADPFLKRLCGIGVPDVRVIVFRGIPVMAMTRLPTVESKGAANIHSGAIGVGLTIAEGTARRGYQQTQDRWLTHHPDTDEQIDEFTVPDWERTLKLAARAASATRLGYAGVDIVFDQRSGPLVLEVNRRPGLGIQNANRAGLDRRLRAVEDLPRAYDYISARERAEIARELDANDWNPAVSTDA